LRGGPTVAKGSRVEWRASDHPARG
jgi:hypothetical protein